MGHKVSKPQVQFIDVTGGNAARKIAVLHQPGADAAAANTGSGTIARLDEQPGLLWFNGFKSQMSSNKASALADWTSKRGIAYTRFDYSGHGQSGGAFEAGTIGAWLNESEAVFRRVTAGPQILVGSSMGGWLSLLLLRRLLSEAPGQAARIKALVLIAPAWDMTQDLMWNNASEKIRDEMRRTGKYLSPSNYDDGPYPITMQLIEDGRRHLIGPKGFDPGRAVHILHGRQDPDVPFERSEKLQEFMPGNHISISAIDDGEHRLSRPQDLDVLFAAIAALL